MRHGCGDSQRHCRDFWRIAMNRALPFALVLAALVPAGTVLAGIDIYSTGWIEAVRSSYPASSITRRDFFRVFQGIAHGTPLSNGFLQNFGFELFSDSGAGFSRILSPYDGIRADDNTAFFELRFTEPVIAAWVSSTNCRPFEAWLGNTLVSTLPPGSGGNCGLIASDPSYRFDRLRFLTSGILYPQYVAGLNSAVGYVTVPAPGAAVVMVFAECTSRRWRRRVAR